MSRQFARWLISKSTDKQIIVATHSPHFVDKKKVTNNWLITNDAGQTRMSQVKDRDGFRRVLAELGLLPSDVFLNDLTIFVEGKSDRAFLEFAFDSLGTRVDENAVGLMPIGGSDKERIKDTVEFWVNLMDFSGAKFLVNLDADRSTMLSQLVATKGWDAMQFRTWQKGSIEDLYPLPLVQQGLKAFGATAQERRLFNDSEGTITEKLSAAFGNEVRRLKMPLAVFVGERLTADQVDPEILKLVDDVKKLAGTGD